jgi:hypothetical protein
MLLAMSKRAQPYISRIVMQSGSALSHWAMHHSQLDNEKKLNNLAFNFINFITCELTLKYKCIETKMNAYLDSHRTNRTLHKGDQILGNLLENTSPNQFIVFLNAIFYMESFAFKKFKDPKTFFTLAFDLFGFPRMDWHFDYDHCKNVYFLFQNDYLFDDKLRNLFCNSLGDLLHLYKYDIILLTHGTNEISDFFKCFYEPYRANTFAFNYTTIINELKDCVDYAVELKKTSSDHFRIHSLADEISYFYQDIEFFYTPVVDRDLIEDNPYNMLDDESFSKIDIMVGVNKHESFYILDDGHKFIDMVTNIDEQASYLYNRSVDHSKPLKLDTAKDKCLKHKLRQFYAKFNEGMEN